MGHSEFLLVQKFGMTHVFIIWIERKDHLLLYYTYQIAKGLYPWGINTIRNKKGKTITR